MGIALQSNYASGPWRQLPPVPDLPTEWDNMLASLKLTEDEAWRQMGIGGAKAAALLRWIEQNHRQRYVPPQFLWRRQIRHGGIRPAP